jgi:hypothetical protein
MATVLAGCVGLPSADVYVPTYGPMNGYPTGLIQGTLVVDRGCLWIDSGRERSLVLWPDGTFVTQRDGGYVVRVGGRETPVGVPVAIGGGQYGQDNYASVVDLIGEEVPASCREAGLYWLGATIEQVGD